MSPTARLVIDRRARNGTVVLRLRGELDIESAGTLAGVLGDAEIAHAAELVLDLAGLEFIDSSGISVLVQARLRAERDNRRLALANVPANVDHILSIAGIKSRFTVS